MVIGIANYAYLVPYVENEEELFLIHHGIQQEGIIS